METLAQSLRARAFDALAAWPAYGAFEQALREFPGVRVYLAGGVIRDLVTGPRRAPKDFDFFLLGDTVDPFLERLAGRGEVRLGPFGSPRWFPTEVREQYADLIPIQKFHNGLWPCQDIVDALNQFDFTANAIALDLRTSALFDPQNGVRDASQGILRAVRFDYPDEPIAADCALSRLSVLWFRLLHYASILHFSIEPITLHWLKTHAHHARDRAEFEAVFFSPVLDAMP